MILWNVPSGNKLKVIVLSMGWVMFVAFSGCGQYLFTGRLWAKGVCHMSLRWIGQHDDAAFRGDWRSRAHNANSSRFQI